MAELPPLTQKSEQSPHIFVDTAGSPLSVCIDVNPEILARPRLTRLLRVGIHIPNVMPMFRCLMLAIYHFQGIRCQYMPQSFGCHHPSYQPEDEVRSQNHA